MRAEIVDIATPTGSQRDAWRDLADRARVPNPFFKIALDERFTRFSPGIQLEVANFDLFHRSAQLTWMDSCAVADNTHFNRLWPDRCVLQSAFVCSGGVRGALGSGVWRAARSAHGVKRRMRTPRDIADGCSRGRLAAAPCRLRRAAAGDDGVIQPVLYSS